MITYQLNGHIGEDIFYDIPRPLYRVLISISFRVRIFSDTTIPGTAFT
jgi:hypothetical protein